MCSEFRHNIVKEAVDPRGDSRVDDNVMTKYIVNNRTDALETDINLFFTITNCRIARSRSLTRRTNYKFMCLSARRLEIVFIFPRLVLQILFQIQFGLSYQCEIYHRHK